MGNVYWRENGKWISIFCIVGIPVSLLAISTADNNWIAAGFGGIIIVFLAFLVKSFPGWMSTRRMEKARKERLRNLGHLKK